MSANGTAIKNTATGGCDTDAFNVDAGLWLSLCDHPFFAHACGTLYSEREKTLIVSDLHLEKGSSFATKQIFLPPYDTAATLSLLAEAIDGFKPKRVIALGDSFHDADGPTRLSDTDRTLLLRMTAAAEWVWVAGNHDPELPEFLGGRFVDEIILGDISLRHEPTDDFEGGEISGHLHPCARVRGRGRSVRKRCFAANVRRIIMPAFGAFTGGLNVRDEAFYPYFPAGSFYAYMMGNDKLYPIASQSCLPG
ncbi:MAG: ligase-associated DNA damage response endonuclease PdeM [Pseudomonadota bacterium]